MSVEFRVDFLWGRKGKTMIIISLMKLLRITKENNLELPNEQGERNKSNKLPLWNVGILMQIFKTASNLN